MEEFPQLKPPHGVLPGQLGVVLLGRVIMGDIATTMVDLAIRQHIHTEEASDGGWLISQSASKDDGLLAGYEKTLLRALPHSPARLSSIDKSVPEETRKALVHDGVDRGWLRHLHHDQRTDAAEELAIHVRAFQRQMRHARHENGPDPLTGTLLPYALHFGLVNGDAAPLARFCRAWVDTFADLPGWHPVTPARTADDDSITINSDHDLANSVAMIYGMTPL